MMREMFLYVQVFSLIILATLLSAVAQKSAFELSDDYLDEKSVDLSLETERVNSSMTFTPLELDFAESSLCMANLKEFHIINNHSFELEVFGIYSHDSQFYPLFFLPSVLPPYTNLSVTVIFLPQFVQESSSLFQVNTSVGMFEYIVKGIGVPSPYRSIPFLNYTAFTGTPWQNLSVKIYNPFDHPLYIFEIFTLETFLIFQESALLRAPNQQVDRDKNNNGSFYTVIEAKEHKDLISFTFNTKMPAGFYRGFIHIQTNIDTIILPIEIDLQNGGLGLTSEVLHFGTFTRKNEKRTADISFKNFGSENIMITNIIPLQPDARLSIDFDKFRVVEPSLSKATRIGRLTITMKTMDRIQGKLLITTNDTNHANAAFEVPYTGVVLKGRIALSSSNSTIYLPPKTAVPSRGSEKSPLTTASDQSSSPATLFVRTFLLINRFNTAVQIFSVHLASCRSFLLMNSQWVERQTVESLQHYPPLFLTVNLSEIYATPEKVLPVTCWLEIATNASLQRIPLHLIDGKLRLEVMEGLGLVAERESDQLSGRSHFSRQERIVQLGDLNSQAPRDIRFILSNSNPVSVSLWISSATNQVIVCQETMWAMGRHDLSKGMAMMNNVSFRDWPSNTSSTRKSGKCIASSERKASISVKPGHLSLLSMRIRFSDEEARVSSFTNVTFSTPFQLLAFEFRHSLVRERYFLDRCPSPFASASRGLRYLLGTEKTLSWCLSLHPSERERLAADGTSQTSQSLSLSLSPPLSFLSLSSRTISSETASRHIQIRLSPHLPYEAETEFVFGFRLWRYLAAIVKEMKLDESSMEVTDILDYMEDFRREMNKYNQMDEMHFKFLQLKRLWTRQFPQGLPVTGNFSLQLRSTETFSVFPISLETLHIPLVTSSLSYQIKKSLSVYQRASLFIEWTNPFEVDLDLTLLEDADYLPRSFRIMAEEGNRSCPQDEYLSFEALEEEVSSSSPQTEPDLFSPSFFLRYYQPTDSSLSNSSSHCSLPAVSGKTSPGTVFSARYKAVLWRIRAGRRAVIGPIDFHPQLSSSSQSFNRVFYLGNALAGYNLLNISFTTFVPQLLLRETEVCSLDSSQCRAIKKTAGGDEEDLFSVEDFHPTNESIRFHLEAAPSSITINEILVNDQPRGDLFPHISLPLELREETKHRLDLHYSQNCQLSRDSVSLSFVEWLSPALKIPLLKIRLQVSLSPQDRDLCLSDSSSFLLRLVLAICLLSLALRHVLQQSRFLRSSRSIEETEASSPASAPISQHRHSFSPFLASETETETGASRSLPEHFKENYIALHDLDLGRVSLSTEVDSLLRSSALEETGPKTDNDGPEISTAASSKPILLEKQKEKQRPREIKASSPPLSSSGLVQDSDSSSEEDSEVLETRIDPDLDGSDSLDQQEVEDTMIETLAAEPEPSFVSSSSLYLWRNHDLLNPGAPSIGSSSFSLPPPSLAIGAPPGLGLSSHQPPQPQSQHHHHSPSSDMPWLFHSQRGLSLPLDDVWTRFTPAYLSQHSSFNEDLGDLDKNISRFEENLNELLDDDFDEPLESHLNTAASEANQEQDHWKRMNTPSSHQLRSGENNRGFFGPGTFFDSLPAESDQVLDSLDR